MYQFTILFFSSIDNSQDSSNTCQSVEFVPKLYPCNKQEVGTITSALRWLCFLLLTPPSWLKSVIVQYYYKIVCRVRRLILNLLLGILWDCKNWWMKTIKAQNSGTFILSFGSLSQILCLSVCLSLSLPSQTDRMTSFSHSKFVLQSWIECTLRVHVNT